MTENLESEIKIPDELKGLLGEPPLVAGEDEKAYKKLLEAVANVRKPQNIMEWIDVHDFVTKFWEEARLSRASAGLISGGLLKALKYFLEQTKQDPSDAQKYFSENPIEREQVILALAKYGITPGTVQAKAADYHNVTLKTLERMREVRENGRRKLCEEERRRQRKKEANEK